MSDNNGLMPRPVDLGRQYASTMAQCMSQYRQWKAGEIETHGQRTVMGFVLPDWQRGHVWTRQQDIALIESAWRGIALGTYTYNQSEIDSPLDNLLIDGQQRMTAIQSYIEDEFPVFGYRWSELPKRDERRWVMSTAFPSFVTETEDETYLRTYYDLMNFGGTAH